MTLMCFLRSDAIEGLVHLLPAVGEFVAKRCPHLEDAIGESKFENRAGDRWIGALVTEIEMLPRLRATGFVFHDLQRLRILGGVDHGTPGADDSEEPGVGFPRSNPFCVHRYWELVVLLIDLPVDGGIVPGSAWDKSPFAVGTFPDDFAQLGVNPCREPAKP